MRRRAAAPWRAALHLALCLLLSAAAPASSPPPATDPDAALRQGNRLFRGGELAAAMAAYESGYRAAGDGRRRAILAYNLGATAHHLGELPAAVLWYRRSALTRPRDPWLSDNLALAREALAMEGAVAVRPPGAWRLLTERRRWLDAAAVALAWAALALLLRPTAGARRPARAAAAALAVLSCSAYAAAALLAARGPRPAVLLESCAGAGAELPAGSEIWAVRQGDGVRVLGAAPDLRCPGTAVGVVE